MKTICLWCGMDHKKRTPKLCKDLSVKMSAACKKAEPWVIMHIMECVGPIKALNDIDAYLAIFAKHFKKPKRKKA